MVGARPYVPPSEMEGPAARAAQGNKIVLVVEDDRSHRTLMEKILVECGLQPVMAENGIVALSILSTGQRFDLILMDWDMPGLDGLDTVRTLRTREVEKGGKRTPVVAFTGHREPGDRERCLAAGMDAYLAKDVWMPKWRRTLVDNLQGLIAGTLDVHDFDIPDTAAPVTASPPAAEIDLDAFDGEALRQAALLLRDELSTAIDEYLQDAAAYIRDVRTGMEARDADKVARASHPLKSNSKSFGLVAVATLAEAINTLARKGSLDEVAPLVPRLQGAFTRAEKMLKDAVQHGAY